MFGLFFIALILKFLSFKLFYDLSLMKKSTEQFGHLVIYLFGPLCSVMPCRPWLVLSKPFFNYPFVHPNDATLIM